MLHCHQQLVTTSHLILLTSFLAKSTWPNTGKTLAEVFKTQPAAAPPSEKPIPTPPKPASISSDKDSQKGGSAKTTRPAAPEKKSQPRQAAPARQNPAKPRVAEPAPAVRNARIQAYSTPFFRKNRQRPLKKLRRLKILKKNPAG